MRAAGMAGPGQLFGQLDMIEYLAVLDQRNASVIGQKRLVPAGNVDNRKPLVANGDAAPSVEDWQPIATAPKDVPVILYSSNGELGEAWWNNGHWCWAGGGRVHHPPTYWRPFPAPPRETGGR